MTTPAFFFTAEDPREIPKGSRDPLRFLPVWTPIARQMIPYLTTVTPSYRGFLTRFLFHGMLEEVEPALANSSIDDQWPVFCKFEQLCAFVRAELEPSTKNFPGISGIEQSRLNDGALTLGSDSAYWLVRSQKNTGYWGYYHQASLGSQIIRLNTALRPGYRLTVDALDVYRLSEVSGLMRKYEPILKQLVESKPLRVQLTEFEELARLFSSKPLESGNEWGDFWQDHLLTPTSRPARCFSSLVLQEFANRLGKETLTDLSVGDVWEKLAAGEPQSEVTNFARNVMAAEGVIGLCEWVFDRCRMRHSENADLSTTAKKARESGFDYIWLEKLKNLPSPSDDELKRYRTLALTGPASFEELARQLLKRHKDVMLSRKGAPWVEINSEDEITIRDPSEGPSNPDFKKMEQGIRWRYDYFLSSWMSVAKEIGFPQELSSE